MTTTIDNLDTIAVRMMLTSHGDALFFADPDSLREWTGLQLKHRLFAWHEPSFYGTELELVKVGELEAIVLPAEEVIPFFASGPLLEHIEWKWEDDAARLAELAPLLAECLEKRLYAPDLAAYRSGSLRWSWDAAAVGATFGQARRDELDLKSGSWSDEARDGLKAAFSAAVMSRFYGTEPDEADLRREFPALFARERGGRDGGTGRRELARADWLESGCRAVPPLAATIGAMGGRRAPPLAAAVRAAGQERSGQAPRTARRRRLGGRQVA